MSTISTYETACRLLADRPMTAAELGASGVSRMALKRLSDTGRIEKIARGVYRLAEVEADARSLWATISVRLPHVVFCLYSAAAYHGLTQNMAGVLNIAVGKGMRLPSPETLGHVSAEFVRWRETSMEVGVETVLIEGIDVKVTSPARTVVDMFRYSTIAPVIGSTSKLVDAETFHDTFTRYFDKFGYSEGARELRKVAKAMGLWEAIKPHAEMLTMTKAAEKTY